MIPYKKAMQLKSFSKTNQIGHMRKRLNIGLVFSDNATIYAGLGGHTKQQTVESMDKRMTLNNRGKLQHTHAGNRQLHDVDIVHSDRFKLLYPAWVEIVDSARTPQQESELCIGFSQPLPPLAIPTDNRVHLSHWEAISEGTYAGAPYPYKSKFGAERTDDMRTLIEFTLVTFDGGGPLEKSEPTLQQLYERILSLTDEVYSLYCEDAREFVIW